MGINQVRENFKLNVIGKIRLGVKVKNSKGKEYPNNVNYFALHDAPDVEAYYLVKHNTKTPKEIHGFFISNDLEEMTPNWLKLFGAGVRKPDGSTTPGSLKCYGEGPYNDGRPGKAWHMEKKDRISGVIPTRECIGPLCPDAKDAKGNIQCKWAMQVLVYMPHCNPTGVYQIDTTSKTAIYAFQNSLMTMMKTNGNKISGYPFKIFKKSFTAIVPTTGQKTEQFTIDIATCPEFADSYGDIKESFQRLHSANIMAPSHQQMLAAPMEDNWPTYNEGEEPQAAISSGNSNEDIAGAVLADARVIELFDQLEKYTGKKFTDKVKKISVLKKINEPDVRAAVIKTLEESVAKSAPATPSDEEVIDVEVTAEVPSHPPVDEGHPSQLINDVPPPPNDGGIL